MMDGEYIIHGDQLKVPISNESLGLALYNALLGSTEAPIFIDSVSGETVSNKALLKNSCLLAEALRNYGLGKNDIIGICSENSLYYCNPVLAALYCGVPLTTFSPYYTTGELLHVANLSQPSIIFCSLGSSAVVLNVKGQLKVTPKIIILDQKDDHNGCQSVENFIKENVPKNFDVNKFQPSPVNAKEDVAFVLYSSGTTGLPKGVMLTHYNYNASISIFGDIFQSKPLNTPGLAFMPLCHAYGLYLVAWKIIWGGLVVIMNKFSPEVYLRCLQDYKIEDLNIVPSIGNFLAKSDLVEKYDLSNIKQIFCGTAPLSKDIEQILIKRFKVNGVQQGYGMTETTAGAISPILNINAIGSCGCVLPSLSAKIVDVDTGKSLGPMQRGELWCRGSVIMKGYINNPEATKEAIDTNGWLHTGDIAYYDENHAIYVVDRLKEIMKCKGHQVAPAELEAILMNNAKISDVAVIGVPHERDGEVPFAFVVSVPNQTLTEEEVQDFLADQVAPYKQLRGGVKFVNQIPRNGSGKILHRVLRDQYIRETIKA
uniref:Luciferin 4-monooxygenase n=1 Tax=Photinus pyralis TaxID=7054 RepID=A0A1Y1N6J3_PHOPY